MYTHLPPQAYCRHLIMYIMLLIYDILVFTANVCHTLAH